MIVGSLELVCNTADEVKARNAEINSKRDVRRFATQKPHDGKVCIVGGGPSMADFIPEIAARQRNGAKVWATNNTFRFLYERGIVPDAHVILDARPENAAFIHRARETDPTYYLHVSCDPSVFERASDNVIMYDLGGEATGLTVGIKAMYLAGFSGFAEFYLYGFDSSYRDDQHHAYPQPLNDGENVTEVTVEGRVFKAAPWMLVQAEDFRTTAISFAQQDKAIYVAGDGLLPHVARCMTHVPKVVTAVWDLHCCPTSYDFTTFLNEAERHRIEIGAEAIDLVIQPGPIGGFRHDDLPGNKGAREGMLYRVIVGMARLLPSIRNIDNRKVRREVEGDHIFPVGYTANEPKAHYGHGYERFASPILRATTAAREFVTKRYPRPYVTVTLREASHWPTRNSNRPAWEKVTKWLERRGYDVVWVPDTESHDANLFSWDIDLRCALYEGAVVNLGVNTGPTHLMPYTTARYIMFKIVTEGIAWTSREFHEKWGTTEGDQHGGRGRYVFETDDYEIIIPELERFFAKNEQPFAIAN